MVVSSMSAACQDPPRAADDDDPFQGVRVLLQAAKAELAAGCGPAALDAVRRARAAYEAVATPARAAAPPSHYFLGELGGVALDLRDYALARDLADLALAHNEARTSSRDAGIWAVRGNLALAEYRLGNKQRSIELASKNLAQQTETLPEDDPVLLQNMGNLAAMRHGAGDIEGACALLTRLTAVLERVDPDGDRLDITLESLGQAKRSLKDHAGAVAAYQKLLEARSRRLDPAAAAVRDAQWSLAVERWETGDTSGSRALFEDLLRKSEATLDPDDPIWLRLRGDYSVALSESGDLQAAAALQRRIVEQLSRQDAPDAVALDHARMSLGATLQRLGDLVAAADLFAAVYESRVETLVESDLELIKARNNLATVRQELGDLEAARLLFEENLAACAEHLPDGHRETQRALNNHAGVMLALGNDRQAHDAWQQVLTIRSQQLPENHPELLSVRSNVANALRKLGQLDAAAAMHRAVVQAWEAAVPSTHLALLRSRNDLAVTLHDLGEVEEASALQMAVLDACRAVLPLGHPLRQQAHRNLFQWQRAAAGAPGLSELAAAWVAATQETVAAWDLPPRQLGELARSCHPVVDALVTAALGADGRPPASDLAGAALVASQVLRGLETRSAWRTKAMAPPLLQQLTTLRNEYARASRDLVALAQRVAPAEDTPARRERFAFELAGAVRRKESLEARIRALQRGPRAGGDQVTIARLAGALPERNAAAAIVEFTTSGAEPQRAGGKTTTFLAGFTIDRAGRVAMASLGLRAEVEGTVAALRRSTGAPAGRGKDPDAKAGGEPADPLRELRRTVLDPLLRAAGDVDTLCLCVDEVLGLVPFDAAPRDDGRLVGETVRIRPVGSLCDLLEPGRTPAAGEPCLLAVGDIDYDAAAASMATLAGAAAPVDRGRGNGGFPPLANTALEVDALAANFGSAFPAGRCRILRRDGATKDALLAAAPDATFVHVATHGYFAAESALSTADAPRGVAATATRGELVVGMSPLVLCGLALSGANRPADEFGRTGGIVTAEELLSLDLSNCELVVLSACDTSLGVRRSGQGYASLRSALLGAGARRVLTSLWKVGDEATMKLMADFYRRLWVDHTEPHAALWEARLAAKRRGVPFRDWAGWVLVGR